jgi:hypothetical protein
MMRTGVGQRSAWQVVASLKHQYPLGWRCPLEGFDVIAYQFDGRWHGATIYQPSIS